MQFVFVKLTILDFGSTNEKELQTLLRTIHGIIPAITREFVKESLLYVVKNTNAASASEIEAALALYFVIGEGQTDQFKDEYFRGLTTSLIQSPIGDLPHNPISIMYFETISRFAKAIPIQDDIIVRLLTQLLGNRGIRNPAAFVRSRSSYFFSKVVRDFGSVVCNYARDILESITVRSFLSLSLPVMID